jgi:toxin-antitoxin system PIN domain toxin
VPAAAPASVLLYAVDRGSPYHEVAADWLTERLNGPRRVGLPWQSLVAFLRISTHPRASVSPLQPDDAVSYVEEWLSADVAWVPVPGPGHGPLLMDLIRRHHIGGNLVSDVHLAALAMEHGLSVVSADSDFARFTDVVWINPFS